MKLKKEYIMLGIMIIGLCAYLFLRKSDRTLYELPQLPEVNKNEISKIEISIGKTSMVLTKKDDQWYIEPQGYLADQNKVNAMIDVLADLTLTALVSESKNYSRYDLDADNKIKVNAWQAESLKRNVDVGKAASSFRHTFVKLAGDERVFHARDNFRGKFELTVDGLREKTVLSFNTSDIRQIRITKDQQPLNFEQIQVPVEDSASKEKKDESTSSPPPAKTVWQSADGKLADESQLQRLLTILSNLRCDKFIDDRKKDDLTAPLYSIDLNGGQEHSLSIYAKFQEDDSNYPATSSASDYPFLLSDSQVERIMKDPSKILKEPEADKKKSEPEKPQASRQDES